MTKLSNDEIYLLNNVWYDGACSISDYNRSCVFSFEDWDTYVFKTQEEWQKFKLQYASTTDQFKKENV